MSKFTIDTDTIIKLTQEGKKFLLDPESESAVVQLKAIEVQIENALAEIKAEVGRQGLELSKDFTGVQSEKLRIGYRYYGSGYKMDPTMLNTTDEQFYNKSVKYAPNTKAVEAYIKKTSELPAGILENTDRVKQVSLALKKGVLDE